MRTDPPINLLCLPSTATLPVSEAQTVFAQALAFCAATHAFFLPDLPPAHQLADIPSAIAWFNTSGLTASASAAVYYPRLTLTDPVTGIPREIGASGTLAGIYARTDTQRGVWKAPAGASATLLGGVTPVAAITETAQPPLIDAGINPLRTLPGVGLVAWGARTALGNASSTDPSKFIPIRRLQLFIEASLEAGLTWAVFEPSGPALWQRITLSVTAFLHQLFRDGALMGATPGEAFFVRCDSTTTTPADILNGVINLLVGVAPLKPSEFVIIPIQLPAPPVQ